LLCGLLLAGCGGSEGAGEATEEDPDKATIWFTSGEQFRTVERPLPERGPRVEPAVEELLEGPSEGERTAEVDTQTQIPEGVSLEGVRVEEDGTAVVKVSPRFLAGIPAEPGKRSRAQQAELDARLGQVAYTATQFDQVESAKVVSGGTVVNPDVTRSDFERPDAGPPPVVKARGARIPGTRRIQTRLAELRYLPKKAIDGLNGYRTRQAVIAFQSWNRLARDGIVGPVTAAALRTARRPKPRGSGPPKRIEIYREKGVALLIARGKTKRAIHVSTGAPGTPTPAGTYRVFRKELQSWSVPFSTWLPYASYFNRGIALHEYPDVPTYPASHGCVRVPAPEAKFVYEFAAIDRVVVVL
jgi:peptidoglycan hydrolase-like protein with peptidoglycan-binding domain